MPDQHDVNQAGGNFLFRCLIFFACLAGLCLFGGDANGQADEVARSWNQPVKPFRVVGNIYYVGASDVTSFLITTPDGHILLDSGLPETVPQIKQNVAALGFKLSDVKFIINSHAHYDHAGGLAELKRLTKAKLFAMRADVKLLADGGKGDFALGDRYPFEPVKVDRVLRDGEKIELGGVSMTAHSTPGHTRGSTTWTMMTDENGKNYNVVFVGSLSAPGYKLIDNPKYPDIVADYEGTFRKLKKLPCDVLLGPHGMFFGLKEKIERRARNANENPFVVPGEYEKFIGKAESGFQSQVKEQREANKSQ